MVAPARQCDTDWGGTPFPGHTEQLADYQKGVK